MKRARQVKFFVSVFTVACLVSIGLDRLVAQETEPVTMPPGGAVLRISLGLKDKDPTDWNGRIEVSQGKAMDVVVQPARKSGDTINSGDTILVSATHFPETSMVARGYCILLTIENLIPGLFEW